MKIINIKAKSRIMWRRVKKCIKDFGLVWEVEIFSRKAGKYGINYLEILTGNTIDISE